MNHSKSFSKLLAGVLTLVLVCSFVPIQAQALSTSGNTVTLEESDSVSDIAAAIQDLLNGGGTTVTVEGTKTGTAEPLKLNIPAGKKLIWKAVYSGNWNGQRAGLIELTGTGAFEMQSGSITQNGTCATVFAAETNADTVSITVIGGTIHVTQSSAIWTNGNITVSGGTVSAIAGGTIFASGTTHNVVVSGGTVSTGGDSSGSAIMVLDDSSGAITIRDTAKVQAENGSCAIRANALSNVVIRDDAQISSSSNTAVSTYGNVTVSDASQITAVNAPAIVSEGNVTVSGNPTISTTTTSGNGFSTIRTSGAASKVNISGGTVSGDAPYYATITMQSAPVNPATVNVTISGGSKVQSNAATTSNHAISTYGSVEVKDTAQVSAKAGSAINAQGTGSTVAVSGGVVSNESGSQVTISGLGTVTVSGDGKVLANGVGTGNHAIKSSGSVEVSGAAQVSAKSGIAILVSDEGSKVTVKNGTVETAATSTACAAILSEGSVNIQGGTVKATNEGNAIYIGGSGSVTVSGGVVTAGTGNAIYSYGDGSVTVTGGLVFAYGSSIVGGTNNCVIYGNTSYYTPPVTNGMVIAWDYAQGKTSYGLGTTEHIIKNPVGATAVWSDNDGGSIHYQNGSFSGYIPISGVSVKNKSVTVGSQSGMMTAGAGGTVSFPLTTTGIANGTYSATVSALPSGVVAQGSVVISGNQGSLTLTGDANVVTGTTSLTLTIDSVTSGSFSLYVAPTGSVPVTSVAVSGAGGATTIITNGGTLRMSVAVQPTNATNQTVTWSVTNGTGKATINQSGLLTAVDNGTVTVEATANDGSNVYGEKVITISGQGVSSVKHPLTVSSGTGTGNYVAGTKVSIKANAAPSGKVFDKWTSSGGGSFASANSAATTFTMPANAATVTAAYKLLPVPTKNQFTYSLTAKTYNGKAQGVTVTPKSGVGKATVKYNGSTKVPTNAGTYKITVDVAVGKQYRAVNGLSLGTVTINKANLSKVTVTIGDAAWTGKQIKPSKVTFNGVSLKVSDISSKTTYGANKNIGKGTIKLTGKGNFSGSKTITFKIVPKKNAVSKITVGTKQMKVTWNKVSAAQKVTKYEVRYRVKGTSKWQTKSYAASTSSATITKLTKGKTYDVQVRSYKTVSNVKYYSAWSATKVSGKVK